MSPGQQPEETAGVPEGGVEGAGREDAPVGADLAPEHDQPRAGSSAPQPRRPDLRAVEFSQVSEQGEDGSAGSIEMLMDIKLPVSVELGRTQTLVRDILDYGPGTVVELNKLAGDPVDVLVNGKLVAQGEVVVIDDHFGVRVTVLLSPKDRVRSLGG